jgi:dipeptidyl aminopeptidase/acylaminoacyl peptidase
VWLPDGKSLLVGGHDGTHVALWAQPLDGPARKLDLGRVCPTWFYQMDAHIGRNGGIAFTATEPDHPIELYYLESPSSPPRRLTDFNAEVAGRALGKVETITWQTHDKFTADGILTFPPDFDAKKKHPLVLVIHGGPMSASVERFNPLPQLLASHGFVVFEPNYRGSDHLGNAYQKAIIKDWGAGPGKDVMVGVEAVKQRGFVDEARIAVTGWSYGGYMTSWLIGHYHTWKTAIAGAAVTDWNDQYDLSDGNVQVRYNFGGTPWKGDFEKLYREQSPIAYARDIRTPTLILATTGDARVPITQSYRLYHALKANDVPVKFVAYPVSGHFPGDPVRLKDLYRRWGAWLDEQLR